MIRFLLSLALLAAPLSSLWAAGAAPAPISPAMRRAATTPAAAPARAGMASYIGIVEGKAEVLLDGVEPWIPAAVGQQLSNGTQVRTKGKSSVTIAFTDGSKVRMGPNANFKLEEAVPSKVAIYVGLGKLEAWVSKFAGRTFQTRNPVAVASVRGTVFAMNVISPTQVTTDLFSGSLNITDNFGRTVPMAEGQRVEADAVGGAAPPAPLPPSVKAPAEPVVTLPQLAAQPAAVEKEAAPESAKEEAPADEVEAEETTTPENTNTSNPLQDSSTVSPSSP